MKKTINWSELEREIPSGAGEQIARSVGTSLTALSLKEIESLAEHSAWLTDTQVRLYMPMLINKEL